jgi:RNA polymerase sigma-70 factor, ECF subfamily
VLLCDMHEMMYNEIAEALDIPIGTVRSRIARGRGLLQEKLREYAEARGLI